MKVMVMVKATPSSEAADIPTPELIHAMGDYNEELVKAGIMKFGDGLKPSSEAVRVRFSGKDRAITNGPFAETNELIAGYWLWEVTSMEEAIEWVKRCPNPMIEDSDIDIRPLYEMEDYEQWDPSSSLSGQETRLKEIIACQNATTNPYLFFSGRCEEALGFYQQALGAQVTYQIRFSEAPDMPEGSVPEDYDQKLMHCEFKIGSLKMMASDGCGEHTSLEGFRLALTFDDIEHTQAAFKRLAEDGKIDMPLCETFWSPLYGQVTDKFGIGWMVMVSMPDQIDKL